MIQSKKNASVLRVVKTVRPQAKTINMSPKNGDELPFRTSTLKFFYRELSVMNNRRG